MALPGDSPTPVFLDTTPQGLKQFLAERFPACRAVLCTESSLKGILSPLVDSLAGEIPGLEVQTFPGGEERKTREAKAQLEDELLAKNLGRDTVLLALGGGTVTDLVGFVAGTYLRGIPYLNLPTTLLAMVDAAHGGKVAVNTPKGKNMVGLFCPPAAVFVFLDTLHTLPREEFHCGLAECLKHGLVAAGEYWGWMQGNREKILQGDRSLMLHLVEGSLEVKLGVVAEDPREISGRRNILNAGHTVGHAIEVLSGYTLSHGRAVAEGLLWEAAAARFDGHLNESVFEELVRGISAFGFTCKRPLPSAEDILRASLADKKNRGGQVRYVPLAGVGVPALPSPHTAALRLEALRHAHERLE